MPSFSIFLEEANNTTPLTEFHTETFGEYISALLKARGLHNLQIQRIKFRIATCRYETTVQNDIMTIQNGIYEVFLSEPKSNVAPTEYSHDESNFPTSSRMRDMKQEFDHCFQEVSQSSVSQQPAPAPVSIQHAASSAPSSSTPTTLPTFFKISKSVVRTILPEALQRLTLDVIAARASNPKIAQAVGLIKAGQVPDDKAFRIPLIAAMGQQLLRHCMVENSPSVGEVGAFYLHLMNPYPQMLAVYNDWVPKKLLKYTENAKRTLKKRGLVTSKHTHLVLPEVNERTNGVMLQPPNNELPHFNPNTFNFH